MSPEVEYNIKGSEVKEFGYCSVIKIPMKQMCKEEQISRIKLENKSEFNCSSDEYNLFIINSDVS